MPSIPRSFVSSAGRIDLGGGRSDCVEGLKTVVERNVANGRGYNRRRDIERTGEGEQGGPATGIVEDGNDRCDTDCHRRTEKHEKECRVEDCSVDRLHGLDIGRRRGPSGARDDRDPPTEEQTSRQP